MFYTPNAVIPAQAGIHSNVQYLLTVKASPQGALRAHWILACARITVIFALLWLFLIFTSAQHKYLKTKAHEFHGLLLIQQR